MERSYGRYRVIATVGSGGMGEVHRARDERLGRDVAVKTLRNVGGMNADAFRARFAVEARALAALSHPAIVQVHDLGIEGDEPYLVMELVDGPSLKQRIADGLLSAAEIGAMGIQVARGLEAAHRGGILHRDVKPANILRSSAGDWKLADFGIARVPDSELTIAGQFLGSPAYAAPEALSLGLFSDKADVFGLAMTMVEALTGTRVRGDATFSELARRTDEAVELPMHLPTHLASALRLALARDPTTRPTAARFAELLAADWGQPSVATTLVAAPPPAAPAPRQRKTAWMVATIAGGLVAVGVMAALLASGDAGKPAAKAAPVPAVVPDAQPRRTAPDAGPERELPPIVRGRITVVYPPRLSREAYEAYGEVAEKLREQDLRAAVEKLDEYEQDFGASPESRHLRAQIEAVPRSRHE